MPDLPELIFSGSLSVEVGMNLIEHFTKLSTAFHRDYWEMDLADRDYEEEYQRPLAWVMSWLDQDMENADIGRSTPGGTHRTHEIDWDGVRTTQPASARTYGAHNAWTEKHFEQLISLVPWMVPLDKRELSREDLFRIPSDTDVPLFDLEATNPHIHPITTPPEGEST